MAVFFTSDMHIGHKFVAFARRNGGDYDYANANRDKIAPEDVQWHDDMLAQRWDSVVGKDDIVWVVGDMTGGGQIPRGLDWIKARRGVKHLITGNHDRCHPMHRDAHTYQRKFLDVFESVQQSAYRRIAKPGGGHIGVRISHFPYTEDHSPEARYTEWRLVDDGGFLIHGHTHSSEKFSPDGREIHVGVDAWDYTPVSLDVITEHVNKTGLQGAPGSV